ncbi:MAG: tetratricopeptide repeat protein, partial [Rhodoplanes sp.]
MHVSDSIGEPLTATPATGDPEIAALSEQAKNTFRRRMNPPAPYLMLLQIAEREETQAARDYAVRAFEAALDSLAAEAGRSAEAADAVKAALRKFVATGKVRAADAIFADIIARTMVSGQNAARQAAAATRHSVALVELPAALAPMIKLPGEAVPFAPLGEKALPAYRRAAALDPDDPWTWIAIAWIEQVRGAPASEVETAINAAERAASSAGDVKATITALQTRGQLRAAQNRLDDAAQALREAVRLSEAQAAGGSGALADLALHLNLLGNLDLRRGDTTGAASAFERAFTLRQRLAASPDDQTAQLNVAASHVRLALLASQSGRADEASQHWNEGFAIYHTVASRDRFMPTFDAAQPGSAVQIFVLAGALTLVGGIVLLARYRRAVDRLMKAAASAGDDAAAPTSAPTSRATAPIVGTEAPVELAIRTVSVSRPPSILARLFPRRGAAAPRSAPMAGAKWALQRATLVQVLAGAAFATVATILMFIYGDIEYTPVRAALFFWSWAWPVVIVLGLLWGRDRARMGFVLGMYLGGLLMICVTVAASDTPPLDFFGVSVPPFFQPLIFWAQSVIYSLFLLFFLNRHVRSVGPVLLVFMLIASIGGLLAQVGMSTYAAWRAFSVVSATLGLPPSVIFLLATPLGMMVLALPAWWVIGRIRRAYQAKRISELTLMFDGIWLFQTLFLCQSLIFEAGLQGWIGLTA